MATIEENQYRLFVLDEMLSKIERRHGIGCECATCKSIIEEMGHLRSDLRRRFAARDRMLALTANVA